MAGLDSSFLVAMAMFLVVFSIWCFVSGRKVLLLSLLALMMFSNVVISALSPLLASKTALTVFQGINFGFACIVFSIVFLKIHRSFEQGLGEDWRDSTVFFIVLVLIYFAFGVFKNGFVAASIYLRMFFFPIALAYIGYWIGKQLKIQVIELVFVFLGVVTAIFIVTEVFVTEYYYYAINAHDFFSLKGDEDAALSIRDLVIKRMRKLLNLYIFQDVLVFRPAGPTFNYPSSSYIIVYSLMSSLLVRAYWAIPILLIGSILLGTKAGFVSIFFVIFWWGLAKARIFHKPMTVNAIGLLYGVLALAIMLQGNDIHTFSLLSSIYNFPKNPFGQGLGFGGSTTVEAKATWEYDMLVGDSGVAMSLNMFGVFSVFIYMYYMVKLWRVVECGSVLKDIHLYMFSVFGVAIMYNSIIQELALGPYAIGFSLFLICARISNLRSSNNVSNRNESKRVSSLS